MTTGSLLNVLEELKHMIDSKSRYTMDGEVKKILSQTRRKGEYCLVYSQSGSRPFGSMGYSKVSRSTMICFIPLSIFLPFH
jgi:hypothetical protein